MIALLTGAPGVGKSTVARRLAALHPHEVAVVGFGELIYRSVNARTPLSYEDFRSAAWQVVKQEDLTQAAKMLVSLAAAARTSQGWLVVESHAVAREAFGWQAHPDSPATLADYAYDVLLHLDAPPKVVLSRSQSDNGGRLARDDRDVAVLAAMQMAVSVFYAGTLGIAMNVIDASGPLDDVVSAVQALLGLAVR